MARMVLRRPLPSIECSVIFLAVYKNYRVTTFDNEYFHLWPICIMVVICVALKEQSVIKIVYLVEFAPVKVISYVRFVYSAIVQVAADFFVSYYNHLTPTGDDLWSIFIEIVVLPALQDPATHDLVELAIITPVEGASDC